MARALMVLGTGSHVGKSLLTAALCRILADEGYRVAPFKAQNMSLNSAATFEGLEIGRAQAMQAEAARIAPSADMNPVLIKPSSDTGAQVVVRGKIWRQVEAFEYFSGRTEELFPIVLESYQRLAERHDVVVLEGAGSPAEINLRERDIVNLRMAEAAGARCLLVGDIDRGGVFASLVGTLALLDDRERARIRGLVINKFRGDRSLLDPGLRWLEARTGRRCLGVVPFLRDLGMPEEDGVAAEERRSAASSWRDESGCARALRAGVVALPHLANFTDFDALDSEPSVAVAYLTDPREAAGADLLIVPGSKQTLADLAWLREKGFEEPIRDHAARGGLLIGICGGLQMLGNEIRDPQGVEGGGRARGLGLLAIETVLAREKVTRRACAELREPSLFGRPVETIRAVGYEIHVGRTLSAGAAPLFRLWREGSAEPVEDGARAPGGRILGTYLHGIFDDDAFRHEVVRAAREAGGLGPPGSVSHFSAERASRFDRLAASVREAIDVPEVLRWIE